MIGPWRRADARDLHDLCAEALRLEDPPHDPPRGLLDTLSPPQRYPTITAALDAVRARPVYGWIKQHLPRVVNLATSPLDEIWLVQHLVRYMVIGWGMDNERDAAPPRRERRDKKRTAAYRQIERLEQAIAEGVLPLVPVRLDALCDLLAEARGALARPVARPVRHMALQALAHVLSERMNTAIGASVITDIAGAMGIDCDERTAQRYVRTAAT